MNSSMFFLSPLQYLDKALTSVQNYFQPPVVHHSYDFLSARGFDPSETTWSNPNGIFTEDDLVKEPNSWLDYKAMEGRKTMTYEAISLAQEQILKELLYRHIVNASERARQAFYRLQGRIHGPPYESYSLLDVMDEMVVANRIRRTVDYNGIHIVAAFDRLQGKGKFFLVSVNQ